MVNGGRGKLKDSKPEAIESYDTPANSGHSRENRHDSRRVLGAEVYGGLPALSPLAYAYFESLAGG